MCGIRINFRSKSVGVSQHVSGVFYNGEDNLASIHDGALVVIGDLEDHDVYPNTKDINKRKLTAPAADTDKVAIVDYVGVSQADVLGVVYRIGDSATCC